MESDDNVAGEFQRSTRMPLDAVVRLHFQGTVAYQNGFAANVSATGMFVKHPAPPPLGTQLVFEFNLGAERKPVQGAGEVVWVRDKYLGPGQPAGVGIRFLQLDTQSRDHIAEALFEYLEQSLAEDSLLDSSGYGFSPQTSAKPSAGDPPADASGALQDLEEGGGIYSEELLSDIGTPAATSEAFDFADLERLPRPAAAAPALDRLAPTAQTSRGSSGESKRAFSVFSPIDEADPQTADIVREALRDEPPLPMLAAAAARSSERESPRIGLWIVVLALLAGGGYFAWKQWGAGWLASRQASAPAAAAAPAAAPPAARRPEPLTAAPAPGTTLAETIGVDQKMISPAAAPPHSAPSTAPPEEPSTTAPSEEPSDVAVAAQEEAAATPAAAAAARPQPPAALPAGENLPRPPAASGSAAPVAPAPAATPPATAERARVLTGIEWHEAGDAASETVLVLLGDGTFATGSFSYSEIGGENPRVLIKLKGMQNPYRGPAPRAPKVGGGLVRGVRTGFHVTANGNEIHVVVDLARGGVKVASLAPEAAGLSLRLTH